jgi:hypothetical protein
LPRKINAENKWGEKMIKTQGETKKGISVNNLDKGQEKIVWRSAALRAVCAFLLLIAYGFPVQTWAQTCDVNVAPGVPDQTFDSIFTQNGPGTGLEPEGASGWTGGDSTYSVKLPNGDSAFFFSDSYIGESPALEGDGTVTTNSNGLRTRQPNCGPPLCDPPTVLYRAHNSIVVRDHVTGALRTLTGPKDVTGYATSYFTPLLSAVNNTFFWMGDSIVVQTDAAGTKKLWVFLLEFNNSYAFFGTSVAQLSLPDLKIESIKSITPPLGTSSPVYWGSSLWLEGEYGNQTLYIYGMQSNSATKRKLPVIARVNPGLGFDAASDSTNWTVWNGSDWTSGLANAVPIIGAANDPNNAADSISDEYSVTKVNTSSGTSYLLLGMDTTALYGLWKDVTLYTSCSPQGPFSAKKVIYSTPETNTNKVPGMTDSETMAGIFLVYNPHFHAQFSENNNMLISYNLNASRSVDLLYADTYRPRFFRAQISGNNPAPTLVSVSGKVLNNKNQGINKAIVSLAAADSGETRSVLTDSSGTYRFENVTTGKTYLMQATSRHSQFDSKTILIDGETNNVDFVARR